MTNLPLFHLRPRVTGLDDGAWANTGFCGDAWIMARSVAEAREKMSLKCAKEDVSGPHQARPLDPWTEPTLVEVTEVEGTLESLVALKVAKLSAA